jgi:transcriptional regulator with XRE-family HTH domain
MAKPSPPYAYDPCLLSLGASIRSLRLRQGLSQEQLAHEANIDRSYMGGIERGEHNVAVLNLCKIASALNIQVSALFATAKL